MFQVLTGIRFIFLWGLSSIATIGVTLVTAFFAMVIVSIAAGYFYISGSDSGTLVIQGIVIATAGVVGAVMGLTWSSLQKAVMNQKYQAEFRGWRIAGLLGGGVGFVLTALAMSVPIKKMLITLLPPDSGEMLFYAVLPIIIPMTCISIAQWFILNRYVYGAWVWILAHIVAGLALYTLLMGIISSGVYLLFVPVLLVLIAPAVVTGFAMLWLFQFNARGTWPDEFY